MEPVSKICAFCNSVVPSDRHTLVVGDDGVTIIPLCTSDGCYDKWRQKTKTIMLDIADAAEQICRTGICKEMIRRAREGEEILDLALRLINRIRELSGIMKRKAKKIFNEISLKIRELIFLINNPSLLSFSFLRERASA